MIKIFCNNIWPLPFILGGVFAVFPLIIGAAEYVVTGEFVIYDIVTRGLMVGIPLLALSVIMYLIGQRT